MNNKLKLKIFNDISKVADEMQQETYVIGGFVRDLFLNRPSKDIDIVTVGSGIELARKLSRKLKPKPGVNIFKNFGTAMLKYKNMELEFVGARKESYQRNSRKPMVENGSLRDDQNRRDFTINTLALRLDGKYFGDLYDYWGGLEDIKKGTIKVLHSLSFVDDPTRMLRAVRYEQRYGFKIEQRTLQLITEARSLIHRVSGDRIRHELNSIFLEPNADQILIRLEALGLLKSIHQNLTTNKQLLQFLSCFSTIEIDSFWKINKTWRGIPSKIAISYMLLFIPYEPIFVKLILRRLKLNKPLSDAIIKSTTFFDEFIDLKSFKPSLFSRKLEDLPNIAIYTSYLLTSNEQIKSNLITYMTKWKKIKPITNGHKLREMGIPPGPIYNKLLNQLRSAWIDGIISTPEEEIIYLQEHLNFL